MTTTALTVIIPARGGSTRVPDKNIRSLGGKPLLAWTVSAAREAGLPVVYVSTNCARIGAAAREAGAEVIERPEELSTATSSTESAVIHALDVLHGRQGRAPDWTLVLPPTSPFRGAGTIRAALGQIQRLPANIDALFTVHETRDDLWRGNPLEGPFGRLFPEAPRRQQEREPLWIENSALYAVRTEALRETGFILGRDRGLRARGLIISKREGFDINTPGDFLLAEALLTVSGSELNQP